MDALLTPLKNIAPLDSKGYFIDRWYLFFDRITKWIADLDTRLTTITNQVIGTQLVVEDRTLTTATTAIDPPKNGGGELVEILRQDGTGGRAITWNAGFVAYSTSLGEAKPNTVSTYRFVYSPSQKQWVQTGQPTTDMSL